MRRSSLPLLALLLAAGTVFAQTSRKDLEAVPVDTKPLPGMEAFDAALEPQVTITRNDKETREEYRINGKLYMVKVTPAGGGAPFYLVDQQGNGNFVQADTVGPLTKPPMWLLRTW